MHEDIRKQLLNQGVKESPAVYVYRLYEEYKQLEAKGKTEKRQRAILAILERAKILYNKINQICTDRSIGNPFKGQPIEAIDSKRK